MSDATAGAPTTPQRPSRSGRRAGRQRGGGGVGGTGASGGDAVVEASTAATATKLIGDVSAPAPVVDAKLGADKLDNAVTARLMKTKMCYFYERGKCASQSCRYAHSRDELRHVPNLQKTKLCKTWAQEGACHDGENCVFAHGEAELRVTEGIYKTQMCHFFERGRCLKGDRCNHAHGVEDLRGPSTMQSQAQRGMAGGGGAGGGTKGGKARVPNGADVNALGLGAVGTGDSSSTNGVGASVGSGSVPAGTDCTTEGRAPLSPLHLAELVADLGNTNSGSCAATFHHQPAFHGGVFAATPEPGMTPYDGGVASEVLAVAAASAASVASVAAFGGMTFAPQPSGLTLGPPPPPPLWSMTWTPQPASFGCGSLATGTLGSPVTPSAATQLQALSPTGPSPCPATPSPSPGFRHGHHHAAAAAAAHAAGMPWLQPVHGSPSHMGTTVGAADDDERRPLPPVDLEQQLAKIDMAVGDLVSEVRELAVAANDGVAVAGAGCTGWGPMPGVGAVGVAAYGGDAGIWRTPLAPMPGFAPALTPAENKVVHHRI